ncbi:MAG TPA: PAS domain-containing protein, partial [Steroidobacteraceae bacterium]
MQSATAELARNALDAAPDAMIILDADGIIRLANRQAATLFGYEREEIVGKSVELFIPERFRSGHEGYRRAYIRA